MNQDIALISSLFVGMAVLFSLPLLLLRKEINKAINIDKDIRKFSTDLLSNGWFLVVGPERKSRNYLNYICKQRGIVPQLCFLNMLDYALPCDQVKIKKWTENFPFDIEKTPYFFSACESRKEKVEIEPLYLTRERLLGPLENEMERVEEENKEAMKEEEEEEEDEEDRFSFLFENMIIGK